MLFGGHKVAKILYRAPYSYHGEYSAIVTMVNRASTAPTPIFAESQEFDTAVWLHHGEYRAIYSYIIFWQLYGPQKTLKTAIFN